MKPNVLILAAGEGKRMKSSLPKVLHPVLFHPMLWHVVRVAESLSPEEVYVVVGKGEEEVRESCSQFKNLKYVRQEKRLGTGDAVMQAEKDLQNSNRTLVVLSGDVILLREETLKQMLELHKKNGAACTLLTARLEKPTGYGRILKEGTGKVLGIREEKDCNIEEKMIQEVNAGIYCFEPTALFSALKQTHNRNQQGEYYLTDVISILSSQEEPVITVQLKDPIEMSGVNDRIQLSQVERVLQTRINHHWMEAGVTIELPETVLIDPMTMIGMDTRIESGVRIENSKIGSHCTIKAGTVIEESEIGESCSVGPYAHLRPGSKLDAEVKIGNFVEIKKSHLKKGAKSSHLSYIGDAEIGENVNLGCGFITCNYDGKKKHRTVIGKNVFVGSDCQTVAPVTIEEGSYIAAGSTVTQNVPKDSLVISRGKQITKPGYAKRYVGDA